MGSSGDKAQGVGEIRFVRRSFEGPLGQFLRLIQMAAVLGQLIEKGAFTVAVWVRKVVPQQEGYR
jgi:hypothetical protein